MGELSDLIRPGSGRGLDFVILDELRKRTGISVSEILKFSVAEMIANALDTDATKIFVETRTVGQFDEVTVRDNGAKQISLEELELVLDFMGKASSKRGFLRVSRGYLGNALKCLFGYSYALAEYRGLTPPEILVKSHKTEYTITLKPNKVTEIIETDIAARARIKNVIWWSLRAGIKYDVFSEHFFIEGDLLDRLCKDVIDFSKSKVLVVNPFVDRCNLSDKLKDAGTQDKDVTLLTRSPSSERNSSVRSSRRKYHGIFIQNGVKMMYNDRIHSKIIFSDNELGIVSSLNFKSESSSGKNLEAGMVTWQKDTIASLNAYVENLLKDYETNEFSG